MQIHYYSLTIAAILFLQIESRSADVFFKDIPTTNYVKSTDLLLLDSALNGGAYQTRTPTVSNVLSASLSSSLGWVNVKNYPYSAAGDGVTDDTAAIQAAINAVTNNGGTIYFPNGIYFLNGGFNVVPNAANSDHAVLALPALSATSITIHLLGQTPPAPLWGTVSNNNAVPTGGAIILCTNSASNYRYSIIGNSGPSQFNQVLLSIENMIFRCTGTNVTPINARYHAWASIKNVLMDSGVYWVTNQPMGNASAIWMPATSNGAWSILRDVIVSGYPTGVTLAEHCVVDNVGVGMCTRGFLISNPLGYHSISVGRTCVQNCQTGIYVDPASTQTQPLFWAEYDDEHSVQSGVTAWMNTVNDIDDSGNKIRGVLNWLSTTGAGGIVDTFTKNGATNLTTHNLNAYP